MKGYVEWANNAGATAPSMNQVRATIKAQFAAGKITAQELDNLNAPSPATGRRPTRTASMP